MSYLIGRSDNLMTRYVLRSGQAFMSSQPSKDLDVYCYDNGSNGRTCLLLSDQSEAQFLMRCGEEMNFKYK